MIRQIDSLVYAGHTHTEGGRDGHGRSSDGALDVRLSPPGSGGAGTNPEQLLGVGYSACFLGAIRRALRVSGLEHAPTIEAADMNRLLIALAAEGGPIQTLAERIAVHGLEGMPDVGPEAA